MCLLDIQSLMARGRRVMKNNSLTEIFIFETMQMTKKVEELLANVENLTVEQFDEIFRLIHTIKGSAAMLSLDGIVQVAHDAEELIGLLCDVDGPERYRISSKLLKSNDYIKTETLGINPNDDYTQLKNSFSKFTSFNVTDNLSDDNQNTPSTGIAGSPIYYTAKILFQENSQMENIRAFQVMNNLKKYVDDITSEPNDLSSPKSAEIIATSGVILHFTSSTPQKRLKEIILKTMFVKNLELNKVETIADTLIAVSASEVEIISRLTEQIIESGNVNIAYELQSVIKGMKVATAIEIFEKMKLTVKSICDKCYKSVTMDFSGETLEISKVVAEGISPALIHIVRNAVDHGVEKNGHINVTACMQDDHYIFSVSDNGKGIDKEKIARVAMQTNMVDNESISDEQALDLIIRPGFTSRENADEVSGRGMGMDIVSKCVEKLGGTFAIKSTPQIGTTITIIVPEPFKCDVPSIQRIASFVIDAVEV